ncbi:MAG: hypothetical protein ACM3NH_04560 [Candidatus Saccharibacteria bacterium]
MLRRSLLTMLASFPLLGFGKAAPPPGTNTIEIPEEAKTRIAEILARGGRITSLNYYEPNPDKWGMTASGTIFFTKPEEREWRLKTS